jgi:hypothetical protein
MKDPTLTLALSKDLILRPPTEGPFLTHWAC